MAGKGRVAKEEAPVMKAAASAPRAAVKNPLRQRERSVEILRNWVGCQCKMSLGWVYVCCKDYVRNAKLFIHIDSYVK